jgi:hypothetical protein
MAKEHKSDNLEYNQPGGGDGEKRASFRIGFWFANYQGPYLTWKRYISIEYWG